MSGIDIGFAVRALRDQADQAALDWIMRMSEEELAQPYVDPIAAVRDGDFCACSVPMDRDYGNTWSQDVGEHLRCNRCHGRVCLDVEMKLLSDVAESMRLMGRLRGGR